jgi:hypothetical protein
MSGSSSKEGAGGQRPMTYNFFDSVKLHKGKDFPSFIVEANGKVNKLEAGEGTAWKNKVSGWCGAYGLKDPFQVANAVIRINNEGTKILPLFPNNPLLNDLSPTGQGRREVLVALSGTSLGSSVMLPDEATIHTWTIENLSYVFNQFVTVSEQLSYLLATSATAKNSMIAMMPDIFDSTDSACRMDGVTIELAGFARLLLVERSLSRDPQGTALQMKKRLLEGILAKGAKGQGATLYQLGALIQDTSMTMINIIQKQPSLKGSMEMEVNTAVCATIRSVCRKVRDNNKSPAELIDAAEVIVSDMTNRLITINKQTWYNFSTEVLTLLQTHLPPEPTTAKEGNNVTEAIVLLSH